MSINTIIVLIMYIEVLFSIDIININIMMMFNRFDSDQ